MAILQIVSFVLGAALVVYTIVSEGRTFVVPRSEAVFSSRAVFLLVRRVFDLLTRRLKTYGERDRIMGYYAPTALMLLPIVWLTSVLVGYAGMFWGIGAPSPLAAFESSGSALFTIGFVPASGLKQSVLAFSEAAIGLILVALFIAYLPTMYAAFQRRESLVTLLEVRAGSPPSAVDMIERYQRIHGFEHLTEMWQRWEEWFADIEESHTSLAALIYFRSPVTGRSWVTAAGAVLDGAALVASTLDLPRNAQAELCIRAGYLALRAIGSLLNFHYDANPKASDPISIRREEYDAVCDRLAGKGIALKPDRDQAWRDFSGWRVNYDSVLLGLADVTMAPLAPWSSDRSAGKAAELRRRRPS